MPKDKLVPLIEEIQDWCETNNVICFIGSTQDEPYMVYNYEKESNNDWREFLQIAKKLNVNIIVLEKEINLLKTEYEDIFEIILSEDDLEQWIKKRYEKVLAHNEEIALIKLRFHHNDICYKFSITSEWYIDYYFASKEVEEREYNDEPISPQEETNKRLTEQEIEDYSRKVIKHDDFNKSYIKAKSRIQKQEIAKKILKGILGDEFIETTYFYWPILRKIEVIFETEIKPKIELDIKQKVLKLKSQGLKKVEIRSKLDISQGMVDRFYHME